MQPRSVGTISTATIVAMLPSTLRYLHLRDNDVNDAHLGAINGLVLGGDLEHLQVLDVQGNLVSLSASPARYYVVLGFQTD